MTSPATFSEQKREAFRLFEEGKYPESLAISASLLETEKDTAVEVLCATNLFYTGKLEDAEVGFKDLAQKMPDSSYVHSYLAKIMESRGDEGAVAEYARAVYLDPTNQDALRSYAGYLLSHKDYAGALPVLRRLAHMSRREGDAQNLVRALIGTGDASGALLAHNNLIGEHVTCGEYIDALFLASEYRKAAPAALDAYRKSGDFSLLKKYFAALARYDLPASVDAFREHAGSPEDADILADIILLFSASGHPDQALALCSMLLARSAGPAHRLIACEMHARHGDAAGALSMFEELIRDELRSKNDLELLERILAGYRGLLQKTYPGPEALSRFLPLVSGDLNIASLLETARFYEDLRNIAEARSWFYRAYRADFLAGGLEYARFLSAQNDERECEKVMLYILSNVKRSSDLHRVAAVIVDDTRKMHRMRRLTEHLIRRLDERRMSLNTRGLELLAIALLIAARHAMEEGDYLACKRFCLKGIDVLPAHTRAIQLEDFLALIRSCKDETIADRPTMDMPVQERRERQVPVLTRIQAELDLDEKEQKIVEFLRSHKRATEIELRKALGTRRIVGMMNRLIQKAEDKNIIIILKKGVGEDGEVYEYAGN